MKKIFAFIMVTVFTTAMTAQAQPKIWIEYSESYMERKLVVKTAKQTAEIAQTFSGDISQLVADNPTAAGHAQLAASHHTKGTVFFWIGAALGFGGTVGGAVYAYSKRDAKEVSEIMPGVALMGVGLLSLLIFPFIADYQWHKSRFFLLKAINVYNGIPGGSAVSALDESQNRETHGLGNGAQQKPYYLSWSLKF
ncbi:MAG: hypothetical protein JNJ69_18310 [Leptospiraceae bacterium]|nr:hypothetical protein [Leptospiraceae bacterium]